MGPDVHVYKDCDFASKYNSVQFNEEMNYVGLPCKENIGFVLEVKSYDPKKKQSDVTTLGWAYIPLYISGENEDRSFSLYTNSGLSQIPIFKGPVNRRAIITAMKTLEPLTALKKDTNLHYLEPMTLIVRIHDN